MYENLIFSLNATIPVFLMMLLGVFFRKLGRIDEVFASKMNKFVFQVPLPVLVFQDLATVDFSKVWNVKFVGFCFVVTLVSILLVTLLSRVWKNRKIRGEFIQASYRSSAAILGIAFIQNIYGTAGMAPLMIIGSVPLYNMMAVLVLSLSGPEQQGLSWDVVKKTIRGIVTNPILIGIVVGLVWSALRIPLTGIPAKTVSSLAGTATPLGLMAMGASFDLKKAVAKVHPSVTASAIKLVGFCAIFLPAAVYLGFRQEELVAILVMLGSATTVSSFVMARSMGHEGVLTSSVVMLTTICSAFTLTGWLYLLKTLNLI